MRHALLVLAVLLAACGSPPQAARPATPAATPAVIAPAPAAFPHEESALAADPAVRWGKLANGARYAVMRSAQPPGRISLRLRLGSGSMLEDDDQRGLAHLLEHMAFRGTRHYPAGTLVPRLQAAGIGFGAHSNAHTSFDETVYKLDLPDTRAETIDLGLEVLADQAGGLLLQQEEIAHERGVVLAELRDRDGPEMRLSRRELALTYAGTRIGQRLPIGDAATVGAATDALLRRYFAAWYRPERVVLAAVGDVDPAVLAARIEAILGGAAPAGEARTEPDTGRLAAGEACAALHDAEADGTEVRLTYLRERALPADSEAARREQFLRDLGEAVVNRRLHKRIEADAGGPLLGGGGFSYQWLGMYQAGINGSARPGRALDALAIVVEEYRRMAEYGPTPAELAVETASIRAAADRAVEQAAARSNTGLADAIYRSVAERRVFRSPTQDRELTAALLAAATPEAVRDAYRAGRDGTIRTVAVVEGKEDLGADGDAKVAAAFHAALAAPVAAPTAHAAATWAYALPPVPAPAPAPAAGDPWLLGAGNGVAWAVKRTDFQPGQVVVRVRLQARTGPLPPAIAELAQRMFGDAGLGKHPASELAEVLAPTSVRFAGIAIDDGAVSLTAACQAKDLQLACEVLRAHLVDAGWRDDAAARARTAWLEQLAAEPTDVDASLWRAYATACHPDDAWRRPATADEATAATPAAAKAWLDPILAHAPLTAAVVGDCDAAAAAATIAAVFGGDRPAVAAAADPAAADAALPAEPAHPAGERRIQVGGQVARAAILIAWPTGDIYDIHRTRRLSLLAGCFGERLRLVVREKFGDAYSPSAWSSAGDDWRGQGALRTFVSVSPERADAARDAVLGIAEELGQGVAADILEQVRRPALRGVEEQKRQNGWWLGLMARAVEQPFRLEWQAGIADDLKAATPEELAGLAKQFLGKDKAFVLIASCPGEKK